MIFRILPPISPDFLHILPHFGQILACYGTIMVVNDHCMPCCTYFSAQETYECNSAHLNVQYCFKIGRFLTTFSPKLQFYSFFTQTCIQHKIFPSEPFWPIFFPWSPYRLRMSKIISSSMWKSVFFLKTNLYGGF